MGKRLDRDAWLATPPPVYWIKAKEKDWLVVHRDLILKWLEANASGWFYYDGESTYVFERDADRMLFKLWVADNPVSREAGQIEKEV